MTTRVAGLFASLLLFACSGAATQQPCECPASTSGVVETASDRALPPAEVVSGPMLGYTTQREVAVWVETERHADSVTVRYWDRAAPELVFQTDAADTETSRDATHLLRVSGLTPGTDYGYSVVVDGRAVERPYELGFRTQDDWRWQTDPWEPPEFRFAFGSCVYINDEPFDRVGDPYGGGYQVFDSIARAEPDVMLWLGDSTYYREGDWSSRAMMAERFGRDRATPEMQSLLAATSNYAIWDDHDFGPNDSDRSFEFQGEALEIFRNYWANPTYGLPHQPGVFTRFVWSDVEFFMLDDRMYRAPNDAPNGPDKPYLGDVQLAWLLDSLTSSSATFKIIANGNQVINDHTAYESYAQFPDERARLLQGIVDRGIEGVVFISGDRHHTELLSATPDAFYTLYEYTSSPLTSGAADARHELDNPQRVDGTLVVSQRNFATVDVRGPAGDRSLTFSAWDSDGGELWSVAVSEHELRAPE